MLVRDILSCRKGSVFSFEFFPPKNAEDSEALFRTIADLHHLHPSYVSVTYGAGGGTRERTHDLVLRIQRESGITVVSHLTCVNATQSDINDILDRYHSKNVHNILALRGDPPKGAESWQATDGGFLYAADLVAHIRQRHPDMGIGVAGFPEGHPATPNRLQEMDHLKAKVNAGADYIATQLFFDNRDFWDFSERCQLAGITVPIIAGIMPVTTRAGLIRMAELAGGARIPAPLLRAVMEAADDTAVFNVGLQWATDQVADLVRNGVAGVHFYTLNKANATRLIFERLLADGTIPQSTPS